MLFNIFIIFQIIISTLSLLIKNPPNSPKSHLSDTPAGRPKEICAPKQGLHLSEQKNITSFAPR